MKRAALLLGIAAGAAFLWFLDQAYRLGRSDGKRIGRRIGFNEAMDAQLMPGWTPVTGEYGNDEGSWEFKGQARKVAA